MAVEQDKLITIVKVTPLFPELLTRDQIDTILKDGKKMAELDEAQKIDYEIPLFPAKKRAHSA